MQLLRQSTAVTRKIGPFVDSTDGVTPETGLTIAQADVRLSKNGGDFAQKNDATGCTHDEDGWYGCPLDATDTGTLGSLVIAIAVSGALPVWHEFTVVPANVYDALVAGSDVLEADLTQIGGDTQSATDLKDFADAGYDPSTNKVEGVKTADALTANNDKTGYSLANAAITAAVIDTDAIDADALASDAVGEIADGVWDEQLTGATHNVPTSAGRRLRQIDTAPFYTTYYVNGTTGDDSNDGDAPDVPFATIGKALSSVSAGDHIVIAAGTYSESNLTLSTASVVVFCEPGVIIDSGGASACLAVSASSCKISGAIFHPSSASVGLDVQAGADYVTIEGCCACQCSVGFDVDGDATWLRNCRSIEHSTTGFDIASKYNRIDHCKAVGAGAAVRGFYLSATGADLNQLLSCTSIGNTTAGFETVSGADQNTFAFCASGGSDGGRVDNGSNNAWSGYAVDPALTQDDILSDSTPFDGANIDAAISSRSSHSANDVRDAILSDSTPFDGANIDAAISSRASKLYLDDLVVLGTITDIGYGGDPAWVETDLAQKADDYYNGCVLFVLTGAGAKQRTVVTDTAWTGTAMRLTVENLGQIAPNDTFALLPSYAHGDPDPSGYIDVAISSRSSHDDPDPNGYINKLNVSGTLAHSDAADTYKADVSALALEATLDAMKGAGWTDETLKAIKDAVDAISGDATAANQTTIINHLTDIKGGTWSDETLVALKALLDALPTTAEVNAEVDQALSDYDPPTKAEMDAAFDEIKQTANGGYDRETDSLEALRDRGDTAWTTGGSGTGTNTVTLTFVDTNGDAVADTKITIKGTGISGTTNTNGVVVFYLDDGTYTVINPDTGTHEGEENDIVVSGDTSETITITANTVASPANPNYCRVFCYAIEPDGDIPSSGSLEITGIHSPATSGSGAGTLTIVMGDDSTELDASGYAHLDILRGAVVDLALYTNGRETPITKRRVTVPDASTANWETL